MNNSIYPEFIIEDDKSYKEVQDMISTAKEYIAMAENERRERAKNIAREALENNEEMKERAAISCKVEAENSAKWGYDSDWGLKYTAKVIGDDMIRILGRDIQFKNGFGAQRYAAYTGIYYISSNSCIITGIK